MNEYSLIDLIFEQMETDDCNRQKQSALLLKLYDNATKDQLVFLDEVLICLCGYSMDTLIDMFRDIK